MSTMYAYQKVLSNQSYTFLKRPAIVRAHLALQNSTMCVFVWMCGRNQERERGSGVMYEATRTGPSVE